MESICPICKKPYDGVVCIQCTVTDLDVSGLMVSEGLEVETSESGKHGEDDATAFLVDLVSNRKIPITTPTCKVGRDDLNDIVISGDQSISRFHFVINKENGQYSVQDGKSRHGTFLNGNQIAVSEPIHDGDVLKVGVSLFWFVIESSSQEEEERTTPVDITLDHDPDMPLPSSKTQPFQTEALSAPLTVEKADMPTSKAAAAKPARDAVPSIDAGEEGVGQFEKYTFFEPLTAKEAEETPAKEQSEQLERNKITKPPGKDAAKAAESPSKTKADSPKAKAAFDVKSLADAISNAVTGGKSPEKPKDSEAKPQRKTETAAEKPIETTVPEAVKISPKTDEEPNSATLEKLAEAVEEVTSAKETRKSSEEKPEKQPTTNGAKSAMSITKESDRASVPEWATRYFSTELSHLSKELTELSDQVRNAQEKIKDVENRVTLTKGLRNTLLCSQGEELVDGCAKILSMLGWQVKVSDDDKNELRLESDGKNFCLARIVSTETQADRTHLGQLSISQTRYWCEQGLEPKGILIISRTGESAPAPLSTADFKSELAEYASKKSVCLMTTVQLLAIFKEIILQSRSGEEEAIRGKITASNGWLSGFGLEPGSETTSDGGPTNKLSSLLSA